MFETAALEKSLDAASLRHQVLANNIANLNTPGYQAQTVVFEGALREALEDGEATETVQPQVVAQPGQTSIHHEMASLAKNQIMYQALTTKISGTFGLLKWVIETAGR
jgi:flagellar basal-body rod protein FlgB